MKKLTAAQIAALKADGAEVEVVKPALRPLPVKPAEDKTLARLLSAQEKLAEGQVQAQAMQARALSDITLRLGESQANIVDKLKAVVQPPAAAIKPTPYRFIIKRDKRGLIESVDAYPIQE